MVPIDVRITDLIDDAPSSEVLEIGDSVNSFDGVEIVSGTDLTDASRVIIPGIWSTSGSPGRGRTRRSRSSWLSAPMSSGQAMIGITVSELTEPPFPGLDRCRRRREGHRQG